MTDKKSPLGKARQSLVPPAISEWAARRGKYVTQFSEVKSWDQATENSVGYADSGILERVDAATREVIAGNAIYERDGFLFRDQEYRWPLATALLFTYARDSYLKVVDFGGSLGSAYWQHRNLLPADKVTWTVVEQPHFVERGTDLPTSEISFTVDLNAALAEKPNVVLLSSVLQYVPDPMSLIDQVVESAPATLLIDRSPMHAGASNIPTVQHVPSHIYTGSYPAWIISRSQLADRLKPRGSVVWFPGIEPNGRTRQGTQFEWQGLWA